MNALEILKAARKKIEKPENWTQGTSARNSEGAQVHIRDRSAFKFCASGAVRYCDPAKNVMDMCLEAYSALGNEMGGCISGYNDIHTHAEVLSAFDRAIAKLESQQ